MKLYLSSMKIGDIGDKLKHLLEKTKHVRAKILNAIHSFIDFERRNKREVNGMAYLAELDLKVAHLDLRIYFNKHNLLKQKPSEFDMI